VAASGATVAKIAGTHADGLLTIPLPENQYHEVIFPALKEGAKSAGRDPDRIIKAVEVWAGYDEDYEKALQSARFWAATLFPGMLKYEIFDPREIERDFGSFVGSEQLTRYRLIGTKPEEHIKHLEKYIKMGFEHLYVLTSSPDEIKAVRMYGKHVLPYLHSTYGEP